MSQNYYLYGKLAEAHRQDLLREAEQQRLLASLIGLGAVAGSLIIGYVA